MIHLAAYTACTLRPQHEYVILTNHLDNVDCPECKAHALGESPLRVACPTCKAGVNVCCTRPPERRRYMGHFVHVERITAARGNVPLDGTPPEEQDAEVDAEAAADGPQLDPLPDAAEPGVAFELDLRAAVVEDAARMLGRLQTALTLGEPNPRRVLRLAQRYTAVMGSMLGELALDADNGLDDPDGFDAAMGDGMGRVRAVRPVRNRDVILGPGGEFDRAMARVQHHNARLDTVREVGMLLDAKKAAAEVNDDAAGAWIQARLDAALALPDAPPAGAEGDE